MKSKKFLEIFALLLILKLVKGKMKKFIFYSGVQLINTHSETETNNFRDNIED